MTKTLTLSGITHNIDEYDTCVDCDEYADELITIAFNRGDYVQPELLTASKERNTDIYEYLDRGGDVYADISGMSIDEMEEYFSDLDPAEFL